MNKFLKYGLIGALCLGALWAAAFFVKSNSKSSITYDTTTAFISSIEKKTVATGKVVPEDEVAIKVLGVVIISNLGSFCFIDLYANSKAMDPFDNAIAYSFLMYLANSFSKFLRYNLI